MLPWRNDSFHIFNKFLNFSHVVLCVLHCELSENQGSPGRVHQARDAGVPAGVELEPTVQSSNDVRLVVLGGLGVVLIQHWGLKCVLDLQLWLVFLSSS